MFRHTACLGIMCCAFSATAFAQAQESQKQTIELRYYYLRSAEHAKIADEYLTKALIPALNRAGRETIGVFREEEEQAEPLRLIVIAHDSIESFAALPKKLADDNDYQNDADTYMALNKEDSPLMRIHSEVLESYDCWPKLKIPALSQSKADGRIFELRIYESSNQRFGDLKVEMFNSGEVPIFLESGITPVFMGQAIAGDKMPSLSYLTVYADQVAKDAAWKKFVEHPDWKVLKKVEKYQGTVSKIHKLNLVPLPGSQL